MWGTSETYSAQWDNACINSPDILRVHRDNENTIISKAL